MSQASLFEPEAIREPPAALVAFLAGQLKQWAVGDRKAQPAERKVFERIARNAIVEAQVYEP